MSPVPTVAEASGGPDRLDLAALKEMGIRELAQVAKSLEIPGAATMKKQELVFQILRAQAENRTTQAAVAVHAKVLFQRRVDKRTGG